MARELPYIAAIGEAIHQEMERDETVLYFGQNIATHRERPVPAGVRLGPRPRDADLRDRRDRDGGRRGVRRLPAGRGAVHGGVHARRDGPGRERGEPLPLHDGGQVKVPVVLKAGYGFTAGWAGQHTGTIYGMFMGVPGLKVAVPATPRTRRV